MKLSAKNILIALMAVVIIFLLFQWKCKSVPKLDIENSDDRIARIDTVIVHSGLMVDSIAALQTKAEQEAELWKDYAQEVDAKYSKLEKQIGNKIDDAPCPDSFKQDLIKDYDYLKEAVRKKDEACLKSITAKDKQIAQSKKIIDIKTEAIAKLRKEAAGAVKDTKAAIDYAKPRNELYAGISLNVAPALGYGATVGVKTKDGWLIDVTAMQVYSKTNFQISAKHTFKFRR